MGDEGKAMINNHIIRQQSCLPHAQCSFSLDSEVMGPMVLQSYSTKGETEAQRSPSKREE